jgi:hypothetical protein
VTARSAAPTPGRHRHCRALAATLAYRFRSGLQDRIHLQCFADYGRGDYFRATVGPAASGVGVPPRAKSKPARPARGSAGYPGEVDEAALDVGVDELHAYPIADVEILEALHHFPLR